MPENACTSTKIMWRKLIILISRCSALIGGSNKSTYEGGNFRGDSTRNVLRSKRISLDFRNATKLRIPDRTLAI